MGIQETRLANLAAPFKLLKRIKVKSIKEGKAVVIGMKKGKVILMEIIKYRKR